MAEPSSLLSTLFYPQHTAEATVPAAAQARGIPCTQPRRLYQAPFSLASPLRSPKDLFLSQEINRAAWPWAAPLFILSAGAAGGRPAAWISFMHSVLKRHIWKKHPVINHYSCQVWLQNTNRLFVLKRKKKPKVDINLLRTRMPENLYAKHLPTDQTTKKQPHNQYITTCMRWIYINWQKRRFFNFPEYTFPFYFPIES